MAKRYLYYFVLLSVLTAVYFAAGKFGLSLAFVNASASAVWPPTGIALAATLIFGYRVWPAIFVGAFLVNFTTPHTVVNPVAPHNIMNLSIMANIIVSIGIAIGNTLEAVVGAALAKRLAHGADAFSHAIDVLKFSALAGMLSTAISSTVGVAVLCLAGLASWRLYGPIWLTWWLGDAVSALVIAPAILVWYAKPNPRYRRAQFLEAVALLLAVYLVGQVIFSGWIPPGITNEALAYVAIPLLLWAAFRFSARGAAVAACLISAMAVRGTLQQWNSHMIANPNQSLLLLQAFMGIITLTALILGAVLSERKFAEDALRAAVETAQRANLAKDQFLAVLSHELRAPLGPVLLGAEMLERNPQLSEQMREDVRMIQRNVRLEARLIDDLLDLTRISKGKMEMSLRQANLGHVLDLAIQICSPELNAKHLRLTRELDTGDHPIQADVTRLQQVFWNLLKNAIKFTPAGGQISVRCFNEQEFVVAEISDTGVGIEPDVLPHIFEAFAQGGAETTRQFGGLGLGLAIARALVELHGGNISVRSAGKNLGSCFRVTLPISQPMQVSLELPETPAVMAHTSRAQLRILLVEDHPDTARITCRALALQGFVVKSAGTIAAARELAERESIDVLVSDLGLPDGSGWELMSHLRTAQPGIKGIAISGYAMEADIRRSYEAGFTEHLTKPINIPELEAAIDRVVESGATENAGAIAERTGGVAARL